MTLLSGRQLISCGKKQLTIPSAREESFSGIWWNVFIKFPVNSTLSFAAAVWFNHSFFSYSSFVAHAYTNKNKTNPRTVCTFFIYFFFVFFFRKYMCSLFAINESFAASVFRNSSRNWK